MVSAHTTCSRSFFHAIVFGVLRFYQLPRPPATVWQPHRHHTVVSHTADKPCPVTIPFTYLHSCTENVVEGGFSGCILWLWCCILWLWCWKSFHPTCLQPRAKVPELWKISCLISFTRSTMHWIPCSSSTRKGWGSIRISNSKNLWWLCVGPNHSWKRVFFFFSLCYGRRELNVTRLKFLVLFLQMQYIGITLILIPNSSLGMCYSHGHWYISLGK